MAPHLMRAQGAHKADKHATHTHMHTHPQTPHTSTYTHACAHTHTHTHTHCKNTSIVVMGLMETEERKQEISRQKRWVFSFDLKEESDMACLTEKEREFLMTGPIY